MTIPENKKKFLIERGLTEEQINAVLTANKSVAEDAVAAGLETKENKPEITTETKLVEPNKTEKLLTAKDIADAVSETIKPIMEKIGTLEKEVAELKTKAMEIKENPDLTPSLSLGALIAQSMTAVGKAETLVPGNTKLAKDKPTEEKSIDKADTGDPMGNLVSRLISGKSLGG